MAIGRGGKWSSSSTAGLEGPVTESPALDDIAGGGGAGIVGKSVPEGATSSSLSGDHKTDTGVKQSANSASGLTDLKMSGYYVRDESAFIGSPQQS